MDFRIYCRMCHCMDHNITIARTVWIYIRSASGFQSGCSGHAKVQHRFSSRRLASAPVASQCAGLQERLGRGTSSELVDASYSGQTGKGYGREFGLRKLSSNCMMTTVHNVNSGSLNEDVRLPVRS